MVKFPRMSRQINVAIEDDLYERAKQAAKSAPAFFKAWIAKAIEEKCDREEDSRAMTQRGAAKGLYYPQKRVSK